MLHIHSRQDPTRTTRVRASYEREFSRRLGKIRAAIVQEVQKKDGFALNARFEFDSDADKVNSFMTWLEGLQASELVDVTRGIPRPGTNSAWQNIYIQSAYQKGLANAAHQASKGGADLPQGFIQSAFYRPIHADRVGILYIRAFNQLKGISAAISSQISQVLAQGLIEGISPRQLAKRLTEVIDGMGLSRARTIARTEIINAHAEGTLNTYEELGVQGVTVLSEFTTAGDSHVCPRCAKLEGKQYTVAEARGVIPVHPNCRCAWLPVVKTH